jgi:hypothetical protein
MTKTIQISDTLFQDLRSLIVETRQDVARQVNSALVLLYWRVGQRIHQEILKEKRAEYGEEIVPTLSAQLVAEFGEGFSKRNLFRMIRFAEGFPANPRSSSIIHKPDLCEKKYKRVAPGRAFICR